MISELQRSDGSRALAFDDPGKRQVELIRMKIRGRCGDDRSDKWVRTLPNGCKDKSCCKAHKHCVFANPSRVSANWAKISQMALSRRRVRVRSPMAYQ